MISDWLRPDAVSTKTNLIRFRKTEPKSDTWIQPEPLDVCLDCWKIFIAGDGDRDLGFQIMKSLAGNEDGYGTDSGDAQNARDLKIGAATDAMIDSLNRLQKWAIYKTLGVGQVWNFPNAQLLIVYADARIELENKLRKNVCTGILF